MYDDFLIWLANNIRSNDPWNVSAEKIRTAFSDIVDTTKNNIVLANVGGAIYTLPVQPSSPAITVEKTIIPVLTPGTYTNFGGVVLPEGHFGLIFKNGATYAIETTEMPTAPVTGIVEEGNTQAVNGGEVYKLQEKILATDYSTPQLFDKENNLILGKYVDFNTGDLLNNSLSASFEIIFSDLPEEKYFDINSIHTIGGRATTTGGNRYSLAFANSVGDKLKPLDVNGDELPNYATLTGTSSFKIPPAAVKMYATIAYASQEALDNYINTIQVVKGESLSSNPNFKNEFVKIDWNQFPENSITPKKTTFARESTNLFDRSKVEVGYTISSADGEKVANANVVLSDFISVKPSTRYTLNNIGRWGLYNANKQFVRSSTTGLFTTTSQEVYARFVSIKNNLNTAQVNEGYEVLPYEPYYFKINDIDINASESKNINIDLFNDFAKSFDPSYFTNIEADDILDNSSMRLLPYTSILNRYEQLSLDYPDYVTYEVKGYSDNGEPIVFVRFKPENTAPEKKMPKIMLTTPHCYEKNAIWCLMRMFEKICNEWQSEKTLTYLRWNVEFAVFPMLNPYGWTVPQRKNFNGVDLARNFPYKWGAGASSNPDSSTYRGLSPASEIETQIVLNQLDVELESQTLISSFEVHNFSTEGRHFWFPLCTPYSVNCGENFATSLTSYFLDNQVDVNNNLVGYADLTNIGGSFGREVTQYGIHGGTIEVNARFNFSINGEPINTGESSNSSIKYGINTLTMWMYYSTQVFA